ncbi:hypothetical protein [uncultured Maricaulis sp.]|uniref:hypothetical protein n=1 Tax=uncultured Maricaulis sp. TaxID=174710 RepID=UPI0030DBA2B9|tara:strand:+ start:24582 stop:24968 length:387 start_codon:yes stop_codon:yes gene_type:complete
MKPIILTLIASASLGVLGGSAWAQEHDHGAMNEESASSAPTMEDCRAMHHQMMEGGATADTATDAPAMAGMSDAMRERMTQCHAMMEEAHGEDADAMGHDHAGAMYQHEPATSEDEAGHEHGEDSQPH